MNNTIMTLVRRLFRGLKSGLFLSTALLILLASAIWFYGPSFYYLEYAPFEPVTNRVIAVGVLVVLWGINNYFLARANARIKPRKQVAIEWTAPDPDEELIALLSQSFRNTVRTVREKWMGKERRARSIYALPWYLVIGPAQSGKTSLITDADLSFPLGHALNDHAKSSVSADLPHYWVTNESMLFDIPGTWLERTQATALNRERAAAMTGATRSEVQTKEKRLWDAFLTLLTEHRPRRPINGVILTMDIVDLIRASDERRTEIAMAIHGRLVEISEKLGTRFTVHIVLTKLDRLAGFRDYFSQFSRTERTTPFGFSFPIYDEVSADKWAEDFEREFQAFITQANDDMLDRLYGQRDTASRRNIYTFSREIAAAGPAIADFFKRALLSDRFSTPPLVRGIYLTSARQEGVPFNALLYRIARDYHMQPPVLPAYSGHSMRFFTDLLFKQVIFRESGLSGDNLKVEQRKRLVFRGTVLASVLLVLGFGFLLNAAMQDNFARAANVLAASKDFIELPRDNADTDSGDETRFLAALNAISSANNEFPGWQEKSDARRYAALYQGRRLGPEVKKAYEDLLRQRFLPSISSKIKLEIDRLGQDRSTSNSDERLDALRVYLLLGDLQRRQELDSSDETASLGKMAVIAWLQHNWHNRFEGKSAVQQDLTRHLQYALDTNRLAAPIDRQTIQNTQIALREVPRDVRLYRGLKALSERQVPGGISFRNEIGPSYDIVFRQKGDGEIASSDRLIPYFYTKAGFLEFFVPKNDALSVIAVEDAWVTGEREKVHYSADDLEAFREKIRNSYATDYINTWTAALNGLNIVSFRSVDDATRVFTEINGPASPFVRLVATVKAQTEIYDAKPFETDPKRSRTQVTFDRNREHGLRIARAFTELSSLVTSPEGKMAPFEELMVPLSAMEAYLRGIQSGQASSKPVALERAKERTKLQGDDPIFVLRRVGGNLPKPFDRFFTQAANNSWTVILVAAKIDLQLVWQSHVYRTFNVELAGRYPFNINSMDEVSLEEFQRFFGPEGEFNQFFNDNLKTFIDEHTGKPVIIDGQGLRVSAEFLKQIGTVRSVRDIFFNSDGVPTLRYLVEPVGMSGNLSRAVLNIEGQLVPYSHGPSRPTSILWPNALSSKQDVSQISTSGARKSGSSGLLSHQGLWSSFRLFDKAKISDVTVDSVNLTFTTSGGKITYRVRMSATDKNPFALRPLSQMKLPEQL
ncbi:type VI secretion system membrane subunit TssM [Neorhizobium sp. T786]|uniref:type VI secretion system membrane subunit TssM n=1 Tax=Pseudorhizobium xiangyangii TaxID=2883104 RepID=UPI001CFFF327|nr:type VI secretion system membrane subunit TssM [Neorhizobium xiangyangii]MCB5205273.1 type VI secretion system membrane subunit TssM [Neorhizobium xiangyangii]